MHFTVFKKYRLGFSREMIFVVIIFLLCFILLYSMELTLHTPLKCPKSYLLHYSTRQLFVSFPSRLIYFGALGLAFSLNCLLSILTSTVTPNCGMLATIITERSSVLQILFLRPQYEEDCSSVHSTLGISSDSI